MSRRLKIAAVLGALGVLGGVGCGFRGYLAGVVPRAPAEIHDIKLPPGFRIAVYAADVPNARMALGPPGIVFVGSRNEGKVHAWSIATAIIGPTRSTCWRATLRDPAVWPSETAISTWRPSAESSDSATWRVTSVVRPYPRS